MEDRPASLSRLVLVVRKIVIDCHHDHGDFEHWIKVIFIEDLHNHETQTTDSDQHFVKSVHCKQLGSIQIIKYRTHVIKGKKQIGTAVNMPQYKIIGHNTSFAQFFIKIIATILQALKKIVS